MNQLRAVRPRVFTVSLPRGINFEDLAEALVVKRRQEDFARVAHFGFGRYEIQTVTEKIAKELALDPTIKVKEQEFRLVYLGNTCTRVSVFITHWMRTQVICGKHLKVLVESPH